MRSRAGAETHNIVSALMVALQNSYRTRDLMRRRFDVVIKRDFARSKAKAMHPEIARNHNYDDHYANDSKDVHSALLHDDGARRARSHVSATLNLRRQSVAGGSVRRRRSK